jgi:hypothetical protein
MTFARLAVVSAAFVAFPLMASAQPLTVNYAMTIAGLPIGSATMTLTPNGSSTALAIAGRAGGPLEIGRMTGSANVSQGEVTALTQSGSGKTATSAQLSSRGTPGNSTFSYAGTSSRGPGKIAMTVSGNRVTALDASIPDNPKAVRVPVTDAHKMGVVDPMSLLGMMIQPGGTIRPEAICGRSHAVFTGQSRFNLAGSALEQRAAMSGMPEGYRAVACRVTVTPISGHRTDKGNAAQTRTATIVFAASPDNRRTVLWSLSVPVVFGSFALTASGIN